MLKIYNTLTRKKEPFRPRVAGQVGMYVCGMTVYDYCHIGHARVMVVFDTVARFLRHSGYALTYVRNITDIDDKIIQRAHENGEAFTALTERFIEAMHEDERALSVLPPDIEPKATESIADIIAMIGTLIAKGLAYVGGNGDVFYSVHKFANYGQLSGKNLADLQAGERVDIDHAKDNPLDFVLWKMAKPDEPAWPSPWGLGRPGWHIECSAMSTCCLGHHFDIHGGGMDLQFPHHENEIAQSEGATGETFVNVWMHNGFVRVNEEKMSKSLGNFFTVREVLKAYKPEIIRFFILLSHYRSPLNYSDEQLNEAGVALTRLYTALRGLDSTVAGVDSAYVSRFEQALARELNSAKQAADTAKSAELAATLRFLGSLLGVLQHDADSFLQGDADDAVAQQIQARIDAKKAKNWALADQIRDELKSQGIILEDAPNGTTTWRREA
jgi:cysteinyl-tRNA synthetase